MANIGGPQGPFGFNPAQGNFNRPVASGTPGPEGLRYAQGPQPFSPYQFMGIITGLLRALDQMLKVWQGYVQPRPFPQPFPPPNGGPGGPPIQALYGVAIGPGGGGPGGPPIQALYGVAIGPGGGGPGGPPIQALYGVAIGPGGGGRGEPPIQALYGVAFGG